MFTFISAVYVSRLFSLVGNGKKNPRFKSIISIFSNCGYSINGVPTRMTFEIKFDFGGDIFFFYLSRSDCCRMSIVSSLLISSEFFSPLPEGRPNFRSPSKRQNIFQNDSTSMSIRWSRRNDIAKRLPVGLIALGGAQRRSPSE